MPFTFKTMTANMQGYKSIDAFKPLTALYMLSAVSEVLRRNLEVFADAAEWIRQAHVIGGASSGVARGSVHDRGRRAGIIAIKSR